MKKTLISASVVFAFGYAVAIALQFAGLISFNVFGLPVLIGGGIGSGVVALLFADYARRPSFRVRRREPVHDGRDSAATPSRCTPECDWTYTTRTA